jgi:hypothetical protein
VLFGSCALTKWRYNQQLDTSSFGFGQFAFPCHAWQFRFKMPWKGSIKFPALAEKEFANATNIADY